MLDNEYNRTKMRGYVMALRYVIRFINSDDDPRLLREDLKEKLSYVEKEWGIRPEKEET